MGKVQKAQNDAKQTKEKVMEAPRLQAKSVDEAKGTAKAEAMKEDKRREADVRRKTR